MEERKKILLPSKNGTDIIQRILTLIGKDASVDTNVFTLNVPSHVSLDNLKALVLKNVNFQKLRRLERIVSNVNFNAKRLGFDAKPFKITPLECNLDDDFQLFSCKWNMRGSSDFNVLLPSKPITKTTYLDYHVRFKPSASLYGMIGDRVDPLTGDKFVNELTIAMPLRKKKNLEENLPVEDLDNLTDYETPYKKWITSTPSEQEKIVQERRKKMVTDITTLHGTVTRILQSYLPRPWYPTIDRWIHDEDTVTSFRVLPEFFDGQRIKLDETSVDASITAKYGRDDLEALSEDVIKQVIEELIPKLKTSVKDLSDQGTKRFNDAFRSLSDDEYLHSSINEIGGVKEKIELISKEKQSRDVEVTINADELFGEIGSYDKKSYLRNKRQKQQAMTDAFVSNLNVFINRMLSHSKIKDTRDIDCEISAWRSSPKIECHSWNKKVGNFNLPTIFVQSVGMGDDDEFFPDTIEARYKKDDEEVVEKYRPVIDIRSCLSPFFYDNEGTNKELWGHGTYSVPRSFNVTISAINEIVSDPNRTIERTVTTEKKMKEEDARVIIQEQIKGTLISIENIKATNVFQDNAPLSLTYTNDEIGNILRILASSQGGDAKRAVRNIGLAMIDDQLFIPQDASEDIKAFIDELNLVGKKIKFSIHSKELFKDRKRNMTIDNVPEYLDPVLNDKELIASAFQELINVYPNIKDDDEIIITNYCRSNFSDTDLGMPITVKDEFNRKVFIARQGRNPMSEGSVQLVNAGFLEEADIPVPLKQKIPSEFRIISKKSWNEIKEYLMARLFPDLSEPCKEQDVIKKFVARDRNNMELYEKVRTKDNDCDIIREAQETFIKNVEEKLKDANNVMINEKDLASFEVMDTLFKNYILSAPLLEKRHFFLDYVKDVEDEGERTRLLETMISRVKDTKPYSILYPSTFLESVMTNDMTKEAWNKKRVMDVTSFVKKDLQARDDVLSVICDFQPNVIFETYDDYVNGFGCEVTVPHETYGTVQYMYGRKVDMDGNVVPTRDPTGRPTVCLPNAGIVIADDQLGKIHNACHYPHEKESVELFKGFSPDVKLFDHGYLRRNDFYTDKTYDAFVRLGALASLIETREFPFYLGVKDGKLALSSAGEEGKVESTSIPQCDTFPLNESPKGCKGNVKVIANAHVHPSGVDLGFTPSTPDLLHTRSICAFTNQALSCYNDDGSAFNVWLERMGEKSGMPSGMTPVTVVGDFGQCYVNHNNPTEGLICVIGRIDGVRNIKDITENDPIQEGYFAMMSTNELERKNVLKNVQFKDKIVTLKNHAVFLARNVKFTQNILAESETHDNVTTITFSGHPFLGCSVVIPRTLSKIPLVICNALGNLDEVV